ncbi:pyridoxamine 5'-phosphate oxidase [Pontibacter cellulosilyticus]|uniref:Pyridoxine/pyridoxamine 5'-phosphate oxidase n=1 Tax=Pontibacter cellulosilyticus TaxID=1720253 RepID=A0A923N2I6_9BACT|nr:pyridoxamine 5'-phosphate oxidase [Pontibacter cellulosilyticus]MBC5991695.1 pyridoxamine 5'-phosphate oxidase [Pontibacter cellulosilyticus]
MALSYNIADIRTNYSKQALTEDTVDENPIKQFQFWLEEAIKAAAEEPTAFVLSTVSPEGKPSARVVLLKEVDERGFVFYTNYSSRKGKELEQNPYACFTFFWPALERQVRVEGNIMRVPEEESDAYFKSRPKGSQIGAWASPQSQVISGRDVLQDADQKYTEQFASTDLIPRPSHWGGYVLQPIRLEFWQGRPNRLHDRIMYESVDGKWQINRLAP